MEKEEIKKRISEAISTSPRPQRLSLPAMLRIAMQAGVAMAGG